MEVSQVDPTLKVFPPSRKGLEMDFNVVVLAGRLAAPPEIREFESGSRLARYLLTVRSQQPKRVDVVPVTLWDPDDDLVNADPQPGRRMVALGAVQRRFWSGSEGRRSRLEVVAGTVQVRSEEEAG